MLIVPYRQSKNKISIVISIFGIKIDTNLCMASLLADKIKIALAVIATTFVKISLTLKEAQSLISYLFFYVIVVRLRSVFMRLL